MSFLLEKIKPGYEINDIYNLGEVVYSSGRKIKANYLLAYHKNQPTIKYAVSISAKIGNSVWRNRFKRLVREVMQKEIDAKATITLAESNQLSVVLSPGMVRQKNNRRLRYKDMKRDVLDILMKIDKALVQKSKNL